MDQIILSLKLYENRINFLQNSLLSLHTLCNRSDFPPRPDVIKVRAYISVFFVCILWRVFRITNIIYTLSFQLLINVMKIHVDVMNIQIAGSACLYNLTKNGCSNNNSLAIPLTLMSEVAQVIMDAMENFPSYYQLQKNAVLILCNDRLLQVGNVYTELHSVHFQVYIARKISYMFYICSLNRAERGSGGEGSEPSHELSFLNI